MPITTTPVISTPSISDYDRETMSRIVGDLEEMAKTEDDLVKRTRLVSMALWLELFANKQRVEDANSA